MHSIFSDNTTKLSTVAEVVYEPSKYDHLSLSDGLYTAMMESTQADIALFEMMIKADMAYTQLESTSVHESALMTFQEGVLSKVGGFLKKLIDGFIKAVIWIWNKLKQFVVTALNKLLDVIIKKRKRIRHEAAIFSEDTTFQAKDSNGNEYTVTQQRKKEKTDEDRKKELEEDRKKFHDSKKTSYGDPYRGWMFQTDYEKRNADYEKEKDEFHARQLFDKDQQGRTRNPNGYYSDDRRFKDSKDEYIERVKQREEYEKNSEYEANFNVPIMWYVHDTYVYTLYDNIFKNATSYLSTFVQNVPSNYSKNDQAQRQALLEKMGISREIFNLIKDGKYDELKKFLKEKKQLTAKDKFSDIDDFVKKIVQVRNISNKFTQEEAKIKSAVDQLQPKNGIPSDKMQAVVDAFSDYRKIYLDLVNIVSDYYKDVVKTLNEIATGCILKGGDSSSMLSDARNQKAEEERTKAEKERDEAKARNDEMRSRIRSGKRVDEVYEKHEKELAEKEKELADAKKDPNVTYAKIQQLEKDIKEIKQSLNTRAEELDDDDIDLARKASRTNSSAEEYNEMKRRGSAAEARKKERSEEATRQRIDQLLQERDQKKDPKEKADVQKQIDDLRKTSKKTGNTTPENPSNNTSQKVTITYGKGAYKKSFEINPNHNIDQITSQLQTIVNRENMDQNRANQMIGAVNRRSNRINNATFRTQKRNNKIIVIHNSFTDDNYTDFIHEALLHDIDELFYEDTTCPYLTTESQPLSPTVNFNHFVETFFETAGGGVYP